MADCFWTDLVGVAQECDSGSAGGSEYGTLADGYAAVNVERTRGVTTLGGLATLGVLYGSHVCSFSTDDGYDVIWSAAGGVAVAAGGGRAIAVGQAAFGAASFDAAETVDGVSVVTYPGALVAPGGAPLSSVGRIQYHAARGTFYAVIQDGAHMYLYEMGATPSTWTLVYTRTFPGAPGFPYLRYIHATGELVLLFMVGVDPFHYRIVYCVLGATGGVEEIEPAFTVTTGSEIDLAYCAGVSKYVMTLGDGVILASDSLADEFVATALPPVGMLGYEPRIIEIPGSANLMVGTGSLCSNTPCTIYTTSNLETTDVVFTGTNNPDSILAPGNFPLVGFAPGYGASKGTIYIDADNFCS